MLGITQYGRADGTTVIRNHMVCEYTYDIDCYPVRPRCALPFPLRERLIALRGPCPLRAPLSESCLGSYVGTIPHPGVHVRTVTGRISFYSYITHTVPKRRRPQKPQRLRGCIAHGTPLSDDAQCALLLFMFSMKGRARGTGRSCSGAREARVPIPRTIRMVIITTITTTRM